MARTRANYIVETRIATFSKRASIHPSIHPSVHPCNIDIRNNNNDE